MKRYKRIDLWAQVIVIILAILYAFAGQVNFIFSYLAVGTVQVASTLIHFALKEKFTADKHRSCYNWIVFWIFITGGICFAFSILIVFIYPLMLVAPILATWYLMICDQELSSGKSTTADPNFYYEK